MVLRQNFTFDLIIFFQVYQSLVSQRIQAGEDPFPITYCHRISKVKYEQDRTVGVQNAMLTLLDQILTSEKLSKREKRKKLIKFRDAYPDIYAIRFPDEQSQPDVVKEEPMKKITSSFSRLKSVIRL